MSAVARWCGFFGAWFLVVGPVYQAALELQDQDIERDRLTESYQSAPRPEPISPWWWLVPPLRFVLAHRRMQPYQDALLKNFDPHDLEALVGYLNKAQSWLLVGVGGLLIAVDESWNLVEHYHWPTYLLAPIVVGMALLSVGFTVGQLARSRSMLSKNPVEDSAGT